MSALSDLYVKTPTGYVSLGKMAACRIKLTNGTIYETGKPEDLFDVSITDEDKNLMLGMKINANSGIR
jgi:hypothetical protein